jgi:hypothetical protein
MDLYLNCPHCGCMVVINEKDINCGIFRHGVYKHNNKRIPPHTKKEKCDKLIKENKIYGCSKPFKYINGLLEKCDYI